MHPRLDELFALMDSHRAALERAVAEVPRELRERRPAAERWSVAEVLEHLALVEERVGRALAAALTAARDAGLGVERETSSVAGSIDIDRVIDRSERRAANEFARPRAGLDAEAALARLVEHRRELRAIIASADGLALGEVTAMNPVMGPLNIYQWMLFVAGHEARHTAQIRECLAVLQSGATA